MYTTISQDYKQMHFCFCFRTQLTEKGKDLDEYNPFENREVDKPNSYVLIFIGFYEFIYTQLIFLLFFTVQPVP